jgi:hypothetical protein
MTYIAAIVACILLGGLAVFQLALVAGAPIGQFAWGGQHRVLPARLRIGSVVAVVLYAVFALIILQRAGVSAALPEIVASVGIWIVAAYLILGVLANLVSRSRRERFVMTPIALVLCLSTFAVAFRI